MALLLSTWIRRFTNNNQAANEFAQKWADIITRAFASGTYNHEEYERTYYEILGTSPEAGCVVGVEIFYPISLVADCLDEKTEQALVEHILNGDSGIYYIYDKKLSVLPEEFESKNASRYLGAIELLSKYKHSRHKLDFVADWLNAHRNENGKWDMGKSVSDKLYFPLSDNWRITEMREADCTERIVKLINNIMDR